jgi:hypothetical protein
MRRFDYDDNEEHREDVDGFFGNEMDDDGEYTTLLPKNTKRLVQDQQVVQQLHIELAHRDLDDRLLFKTIKMLEKSFWWKFYSQKKKIRLIARTYRSFKKLNERD